MPPRRKPAPAVATHAPDAAIRLESVLTDPEGFGLTTATPLQRAICRAADGESIEDLWHHESVSRAFGGTMPTPGVVPLHVVLCAAIRGAKSMMSATKAICASQNVPVEHLAPGDEVRIPVLATDVDAARVVYSHLVGAVTASPLLSQLLIGEPKADSLFLRHPSGRPIEIKVTAMARAGQTLIGRWLAGAIFDEAPRMAGDGSVKSLSESLRAIRGRMLPGAQIWLPGSPHAPFGPVYDMQLEHFGRPSSGYLIIRAKGRDLNPDWWTEERIAELKATDEDAWLTDHEAEFSDPEESLISSVDLDDCMRPEPETLPPNKSAEYIATMDPATRGNAWVLHVLACEGFDENEQPRFRLALAREWIGSKISPLSPRATLAAVAKALEPYGLYEVTTDQWAIDALRDLAEQVGLILHEHRIDAENRLTMAKRLAMVVRTRRLEIPAGVRHLRSDLLLAKARVTQNGQTLVLPVTGDGRHCDHLPPLMLGVSLHPGPPDAPEAERTREDDFFEESDEDPCARARNVLLGH